MTGTRVSAPDAGDIARIDNDASPTQPRGARGTPAGGDSTTLVGLARRGDSRAWSEIVERYEPLLWWLARRQGLSSEDAADAVQLTWLRCVEHLGQLAQDGKLRAWLATICRRECARLALRRRQELLFSDLDGVRMVDIGEARDDPYAQIAQDDEHHRLHLAIGALPRLQRIVLSGILTQEEESYVELSNRIGVPVGSIGPTRQRALARLRRNPILSADEAVAAG